MTTYYKDSIFIFNVTIEPGVKFKHGPDLISDEYFMVFTDWTPAVGNSSKIITQISPFGSWYLIRKDIFQVSDGSILCGRDYMREKLSASNVYDQNLVLEQIKDAYNNGTAKTGVIHHNVSNEAGVQILMGYFEDLGEIIFADNSSHPAIWNHNFGSGKTHGEGSYPWAPFEFINKFIDAF